YLELLDDQSRAASAAPASAGVTQVTDPRASLWPSWSGLARWHLDYPEASNVLHQCRASGILTAETREAESRRRATGLASFREAIARGLLRELPLDVFWALYAGPVFVLADARATGEIDVDEAMLRATFDGVCRSVLPPARV